jgi:hypothetical protein
VHHVDLRLQAEFSGILVVRPVNNIGQGRRPATVGEIDPPPAFQIDIRDLFACAQIFDDSLPLRTVDTEPEADTGAAAIQPENEARPFARAAMDPGIDAQGAVQPWQAGLAVFEKLESGPPHQGSVSEYPEIVLVFVFHPEPFPPRLNRSVWIK